MNIDKNTNIIHKIDLFSEQGDACSLDMSSRQGFGEVMSGWRQGDFFDQF